MYSMLLKSVMIFHVNLSQTNNHQHESFTEPFSWLHSVAILMEAGVSFQSNLEKLGWIFF
jgi:hypothetical protein